MKLSWWNNGKERRKKVIEFNGRQVEIMELSKEYNIPWSTINNRYTAGYRDDDLVTKRVNPTVFKGRETTLAEIAIEYCLPYHLVKSRYKEGKRDDDLVKKGHQGKGNENTANKLDVDSVREIKILLITSPLNQSEIARLYNVDPSHISDIKRGKRWAKVSVSINEILQQSEVE